MLLEKWRETDSFWFGLLAGLLVPVVTGLLVQGIFILVETAFRLSPFVRIPGIILLGLVPDLFLLRFYLGKQKLEKTGRGLLVATVAFAVLFYFVARKFAS